MKGEDVCQAFPEQWVLIEAVQAYTNENSERILVEVTPLKKFSNSPDAMKAYQKLHHKIPLVNYMFFILIVRTPISLRISKKV